ncbi:tRNA (N6-threonylcarbamoyladenosine(37)-N6)-methyltransferase TrmO [Paracraurococcus lichenis]|uniref:tRNA (N6-threonylcarbamoyladenosine(37)-N6)-methyltransferase TrmO n=1 Tax=Paracraurococcus lichenis TaxID=3064888 RepID=A0ABT9DT89_9PROT|nr:tRNA (N6-threonylcarbamoyladenosine(37)-N6)-methyltransferase TrmO [Paracraurococcus sp. LOR1-02]MDO9707122.1 tRNA (N6-threonylcarbamoyladenosine(37)-N6)-methyltransferase TrmO [Paracraurococcus sp. LOR1-02]
MDWDATRPGEVEGPAPMRADAALTFIGRIRTPFATRDDCPRRGAADGPLCRIEVEAPWRPALQGLEGQRWIEVLYWMHLARRDLLVQVPRGRAPLGTFALRSPVRPNPIATSVVEVVAVEADAVLVRGLDCVDGTPLLDLKPARERDRPAPPVA